MHTCSGSIRAEVSNCGVSILIVQSTRHALGGRYCIGISVRGVPLSGQDLTPVPNSKLEQARPRLFRPYLRPIGCLFARWPLTRYGGPPHTHHGATARNQPVSPLPFREFVRTSLISAPCVRIGCSLADTSASRWTQGGEQLSHTN